MKKKHFYMIFDGQIFQVEAEKIIGKKNPNKLTKYLKKKVDFAEIYDADVKKKWWKSLETYKRLSQGFLRMLQIFMKNITQ